MSDGCVATVVVVGDVVVMSVFILSLLISSISQWPESQISLVVVEVGGLVASLALAEPVSRFISMKMLQWFSVEKWVSVDASIS